MSRWWRAYDDALHDPKVQRLPPHLFKTWFNLLCIASKNEGALPTADEMAFLLRRRVDDVRRDVAELCARRLFDAAGGKVRPHNWDTRQYKSDLSTQRVSKHRKRFSNGKGNVSGAVTETAPDSETETEKKTAAPKGAAPKPALEVLTLDLEAVEVVDEDPKAKLFRIGKTTLVSFGVAERRTGALIGQWLKQRADPAGVLAAIQFARDQNVAEPIAYISATINGKGSPNGQQCNLGDVARQLADDARRLEAAKGITRPAAAV